MESKSELDFSVIIPSYNNLGLLKVALNSVLSQKDVSFEIIVVDDSTTDDIEQYISQMPNIVRFYRNKPSKGAVQNWNYGLSLASGKYIILLHHDEYFEDGHAHLLKCKELLQKYSVVISNIKIYTGEYVREGLYGNIIKKIFISHPFSLFFINLIGPSACLCFSKECRDLFDPNLKWNVDLEWYYRILTNSNGNYYYCPELFVASQNGHDDKITNTINIVELNRKELPYINSKYQSKKISIMLFLNRIYSFFAFSKMLPKKNENS